MLIECKECGKSISDKALQCPHCGLPSNCFHKISHRENSRKRMRLPNGFGRITKIKGRLNRPYRAMVTIGKDEYGRPIGKLLQPKAYFKTYNEAYQALAEYNRDPYDLSVTTLEDIYNAWSEKYFPTVAKSTRERIVIAWKYSSMIKDMNIREIRIRHLKRCLDEGYMIKYGKKQHPPDGMKGPIKSLWNQLFEYAIEYEYVSRNIVKDLKTNSKKTYTPPAHSSYTPEELEILWKYKTEFVPAFTLVQCYSGFRPGELLALARDNIHLDQNIMIGGMKTAAGTNRIVPIHPKIKKIIESFLSDEDGTLLINNVSYKQYYYLFKRSMLDVLGTDTHKPHDGRKTFATLAKKNELDEYAIKHIMGHTISDITESVYTERDPQWLYKEICKI